MEQQSTASSENADAGKAGPEIGMNDIFSLRRPRDCGAGLSSGLKSAAKVMVVPLGKLLPRSFTQRTNRDSWIRSCRALLVVSWVSLRSQQVGQPLALCMHGRMDDAWMTASPAPVGASKDGAKGFAKGLAAGVVGAVVLPVAGICVGTVQVCRGIANQPEAIMQASKGKVWDEVGKEADVMPHHSQAWVERGGL